MTCRQHWSDENGDTTHEFPYIEGFIGILDVWGEGYVAMPDGQVTGFDTAYNVNNISSATGSIHGTITNGPNKGQDIPNIVPVDSYNYPSFPLLNECVYACTLKGAPIVQKVVDEMYRVLVETDGVVYLDDPEPNDLKLFSETYWQNPKKTQNHTLHPPFNAINLPNDLKLFSGLHIIISALLGFCVLLNLINYAVFSNVIC